DDKRYEHIQYRRCGRSGLKLPAISLGLWQNFGDDRPLQTSREILRRAFDVAAAEWWLERRDTLSAERLATAEELVDEHRAHLHRLHRIVAALEPGFRVGIPVRGAYLYRWDLGESFRKVEEDSIARAQIPAVGARLVALRKSAV
ncbi:MAG TPA: hypothetical protein VE757_09210, partial [Gaiellaceae bacterium]|nr:hypothetical protein [Gaiellaceae bacterium]